MHELSIAEHLIEEAENAARSVHACAVHRLRLRVGELSGVDAQALRFAFDIVVQGTLLENAVLEIEEAPVKVHCVACGEETTPQRARVGECMRCGSTRVRVTQGRDLEIAQMEIDVNDDPEAE